MKHDAQWWQFAETLHKRLEAGEREYGDASFSKAPTALIGEIAEELLDVCGWAFVLWVRLQRLQVAAEPITVAVKEPANVRSSVPRCPCTTCRCSGRPKGDKVCDYCFAGFHVDDRENDVD